MLLLHIPTIALEQTPQVVPTTSTNTKSQLLSGMIDYTNKKKGSRGDHNLIHEHKIMPQIRKFVLDSW